MKNQDASKKPKQSKIVMAGIALFMLSLLAYWLMMSLQTRSLQQQIFQVVPGASQLLQLDYIEGRWQAIALTRDNTDSLYAGYSESGQFVGYAIPGEGPGYEAPVRLLYGYQPEQRQITGLLILETGETPGWGELAFEERGFTENFLSMPVDPKVVLVNQGKKNLANEVDAMTGATITSQAIVQILNATNRRWIKHLPALGSEPPLAGQ